MGWSGITSIATYSAGNAQAITVQTGEMVRIRTVRPATGPDGEVVIYDQTGTTIQTITVSKSNPDQMTEFATSATSLNYSTTVAFDSPGLQISWQDASAPPPYNPYTKSTEFPSAVRTIIRGQSVRSDGNLFALGPNTQFANISTETDCYTAPVAGLVDGAYATDSPADGIPPIIRAGFMLPTRQEKSMKLRVKASCGINFQAATASASTLAAKMTVRLYLINLATSTRVKIAEISALASQVSIAALTTFLPCDFDGTIAPASLDAGTVWNTRNHDFLLLSNGAFGAATAGFKEQFAYPKIDWGVDQGLIFTQQCDSGYPFGSFFFNQISVERE